MESKIKKYFIRFLPYITIIVISIIIYWPLFFKNKIPFPGDLLIGAYYPWLDYKWGTITGVAVKNPNLSDVFSHILPLKYLAVDIIKSGHLPLWNTFSFSGTPLLANYNSAPLFPANIILSLPKYYSWALYIYAQTLFAALGIYLFIKKYSKNIFINITASLIFSLSALMSTWVEFGGGVWAMVTLPWILYFINRYIDHRKIISLILTSLSLSSLYFAGNYQIALFGSILIAVYLIFQYLNHRLSISTLLTIIIYLLLSVGLSAIVLIPAYFQSQLSVRSSEVYSQAYNFGLMSIQNFVRVFAADFFGNPTTYNYRGAFVYYENSPFLGTLLLPLILPLLFKPFRNKDNLFWWLILFFSLFLVLDSPLTQFIYRQHLPFLTYSSASRILFFSSLSAAVLCVYALPNLINRNYRRLAQFFCLILLSILAVGLIHLKFEGSPENFLISFRNSVIPVLILSFSIVLLQFNFQKKIYLPIIFLIFFVDLSHYFWKFNPFIDSSLVFPNTPALTFLQQQSAILRIARLNREILTPNTWIQYRLPSVEGYDPLSPENYSRYFNRVNQNKYFDGINRYTELYSPDYNFLSSLNVKYLIDINNEKNPNTISVSNSKNLKKIFIDKSTVIYENKNYLDRAYFVENTVTVKDHQKLAKIIDQENFNPLKKSVIISEDTLPDYWSLGKVSIDSYQDNSIRISTDNKGEGLLVVADTYDNGWHVYIDNSETRLYEVNGALRGVIVPKGSHSVKLNYWPKSVDIGLKVSFLSCLGMLLLSIYLFIKNKCSR